MFAPRFRSPIYSLYGFVRLADEIVDTFYSQDQVSLLQEFRENTHQAIENQLSLNPVLHSFQLVVHQYQIPLELINAFLDSMAMDLTDQDYNPILYKKYIYGSADVVGLMCLKIFCEGDNVTYERLKESAMNLGSAFQKVNFLRDIKSDYEDRGRVYFPGVDYQNFTIAQKEDIERDIDNDFQKAYQGIIVLPKGVRLGVYSAYRYYYNLFRKIKKAPVSIVKTERIRVNDIKKMVLLAKSTLRHSVNRL